MLEHVLVWEDEDRPDPGGPPAYGAGHGWVRLGRAQSEGGYVLYINYMLLYPRTELVGFIGGLLLLCAGGGLLCAGGGLLCAGGGLLCAGGGLLCAAGGLLCAGGGLLYNGRVVSTRRGKS